MRVILLVIAIAAGCSEGHPTNTDTVCPTPDPVTMGYDQGFDPKCTTTDGSGDCFGKTFMDKYCIQCHASDLPNSKRNGAPLFHDFDTLEGVLEVPDHIDQQTGIGPAASNFFMPPRRCPSVPGGPIAIDCPQPTDDEREQLALWVACARDRKYDFRPDAGVGSGSDGGVDAGSDSGSGSDAGP